MRIAREAGYGRLSSLVALLGIALLPWPAVQYHGILVGDFALLAAFPFLIFRIFHRKVRTPPALWIGAGLITLSGLIVEFQAPSTAYLASRTGALSFAERAGYAAARSTSNLPNLAKYDVSLIILPLLIVSAHASDTRFARLASMAWTLGVTINSAVAFFDYIHVTAISNSLLGFASASGRSAGLTAQPNNIGVQVAMVVPILASQVITSRRHRLTMSGLIAINVLGLYSSGSRGSAVGVIISLALLLIVSPRTRRAATRICLALTALMVYLLVSSSGTRILSALRLNGGGVTIAESDSSRSAARAQGIADFTHSPIYGIGWGYATNAHVIYLQLLAAGGLLAFIGFSTYILGVLRSAWRTLRRQSKLAASLIASTLAWLVVGTVENQLTDQWIYVPLAILIAMLSVERRAADPSGPQGVGASSLQPQAALK